MRTIERGAFKLLFHQLGLPSSTINLWNLLIIKLILFINLTRMNNIKFLILHLISKNNLMLLKIMFWCKAAILLKRSKILKLRRISILNIKTLSRISFFSVIRNILILWIICKILNNNLINSILSLLMTVYPLEQAIHTDATFIHM